MCRRRRIPQVVRRPGRAALWLVAPQPQVSLRMAFSLACCAGAGRGGGWSQPGAGCGGGRPGVVAHGVLPGLLCGGGSWWRLVSAPGVVAHGVLPGLLCGGGSWWRLVSAPGVVAHGVLPGLLCGGGSWWRLVSAPGVVAHGVVSFSVAANSAFAMPVASGPRVVAHGAPPSVYGDRLPRRAGGSPGCRCHDRSLSVAVIARGVISARPRWT